MRTRHFKFIVLLSLIFAVLLAGLFFTVFLLVREKSGNYSRGLFSRGSDVSAHTVVKEVLPIGEYASLAYHYTTVVRNVSTRDVRGWVLPFTTSKYLFTYDGIMKLGIDGSQIQVEEPTAEEGGLPVICITLPPVKILSHEVIDNSVEVFEQTQTIFNEIRIQDAFNVTAERKRELEEKVMASNVVKEAQVSVEQQFDALLKALPGIKDNYDVLFVWQDADAQAGSQAETP